MFSRMRDVYGLACARHHSARVTRDQRAVQTGSLRNSGFARQLLVDARADFQRIGVAHGEAWTCLELAVVDAGNARTPRPWPSARRRPVSSPPTATAVARTGPAS